MPDAEMTSRVNSLMSTLYGYCRDMRELLDDALRQDIGKTQEGKRIINEMKERVGNTPQHLSCHAEVLLLEYYGLSARATGAMSGVSQ